MALSTKKLRNILGFWELFIGLGAVSGAAMMFISPDGTMWGMDPLLPLMRKLPLPDLFFRNFIAPGITLLLANGVTNITAYILLRRKNRYDALAGMICGIILMLWICVQFTIFTFNPMSTAYFIFGAVEFITAYLFYRRNRIAENKMT